LIIDNGQLAFRVLAYRERVESIQVSVFYYLSDIYTTLNELKMENGEWRIKKV